MRAVRLVDCVGPNPAYNRASATAARRQNATYDVSPDIKYPAGTFSEHPDCWILCCQPNPKMAPADDECTDKVHAFLNHPSRKAQLDRIQELAQPEVLKQLPKGLQDYVKAVSAKWLEPAETVSDEGDEDVIESPVDDEVLAMFDSPDADDIHDA